MAARRVLVALLTLALTGCLEPPVTETLEVRIRGDGASDVSIGVALRDPSDFDRAPRVKQRLVAEAHDLAEGSDAWSARLRRVDPESQRDVIEREHGEIRSVTRQVRLSTAQELRELFADTGVEIGFAAGDGWAELMISPGRPSRATSAQRQRVTTALTEFSADVARYAAATKQLYDYLGQNPERARTTLGAVFDVPLEDQPLTDEEQALVSAVGDAVGTLVGVLDADPGEPYTLDELSRFVHDPFPAPLFVAVDGPVVEREGFEGELQAPLRIPEFSIWAAFTRLEDRWISPDPALALWRHDLAGGGKPFDLDAFVARPRRSAIAPTAGEVRRSIEKQLRPEALYRVRWTPQPSAETGKTAASFGSAGSPAYSTRSR